ncbi:MAG: menaquinone reductase molybdopterin-binding-like subunit QrcB [Desulfoplanes sp.]
MGLDRRSFIAFLAGGTGGILCTPVIWKGLDDISIWSQNWPWIPKLKYGQREKKPVVCKFGSDAYGVRVETAAGRPFVAQGNPDHPLSKGGICPLGAASVQMLYSPSRVKAPMKKVGDGFENISWDEAGKLLAAKIKAAGSDVCAMTGDETGTTADILAGFLAGLGSEACFLMPSESAPAARAWELLGGQGMPGYDIEQADLVLSLGADIHESWGTVVRNGKAMAADNAVYTYVGPVQKAGTSISAKTWVACAPGTEPLVALGIAAYLINAGKGVGMPGYDALKEFVTLTNPPSRVAQATGVSEATMKQLAGALLRARRPLILTGSEFGQGADALGCAAGLVLNVLLGRVNAKGGVTDIPFTAAVVNKAPDRRTLLARDVVGYVQDVAQGKTKPAKVTLVVDANPAYALPQPEVTAKAFEKSDFVVSFSSFMDETAARADLILPASYFIEALDDAYAPYGSGQANYSVSPAIIDPVFDTKPAAEVILTLAASTGIDLGVVSFEEAAKARAEALGADWDTLTEGTAWVAEMSNGSGVSLWNDALRALSLAKVPAGAMILAPLARLHLGVDGTPTTPFGTITIRNTELKKNVLCVQMNAATAGKLGMKQDDAVQVKSAVGSCKAVVSLSEAIMPGVVAMPLCFGHTAGDAFSKNTGDNVCQLLDVQREGGTGFSLIGNPQVQITKA